ncbi:MAG: hypothetical protein BroJett038_28850 [Chloroflexota bacterium]|nr:MAG: hypothetical protein BroJett038_28850 [Chloroflexota bacterium]
MILQGEKNMFRKPIHYFLYPVRDLDDLPTPVVETIRQHLPLEAVQSIVVVPPQDYAIARSSRRKPLPFAWRVTPQRTLVCGGERIVVVEMTGDGALSARIIPLDHLVYADLATILLYGYTQLAWIDGEQIETLMIEYNAVGEHIMRRQIEWARAQIAAHLPVADLPDQPYQLPFKFQNYLKYSLLPGERVQAAVFEPARRRGERWYSPYIAPNRAIAITDRYLIILEEELKRFLLPRLEKRESINYGIIIRFCPLNRVQNISFRREAEMTWMDIRLGAGAASFSFDLPLDNSSAAVLGETWETARAQLAAG